MLPFTAFCFSVELNAFLHAIERKKLNAFPCLRYRNNILLRTVLKDTTKEYLDTGYRIRKVDPVDG
jgi:hypothetical protein